MPIVAPKRVLRVELTLEAHYHGDTALCAFGPKREHLLAYREAIAPSDWPALDAAFGDGTFTAPDGSEIAREPGQGPPLVIITTNEDRMLPPAFVRRCLVLQIEVPTS